jgi:hypothetical protein
MTPGAGAISVIGVETGRSGGWRAAVIDKEGNFVTGGTLGYPFEERKPKPEKGEASATVTGPDLVEKKENSPAEEAAAPIEAAAAAEGTSLDPAEAVSSPEAAQSGEEAAVASEAAASAEAASTNEQAAEAPAAEASEDAAAPAEAFGVSDAAAEAKPDEITASGETDADESESVESEMGESETGNESTESAPEHPEVSSDDRRKALAELIKRYEPAAIAYANGPQTRELERFIRSAIRESGVQGTFWAAVNDAGS